METRSFIQMRKEETQEDKTANNETHLGAAEEEEEAEDEPEGKSGPRRSRRSWAPTQRALESQGQQWDFRGVGHRKETVTTPLRLPPEREPVDQEPEDEDPHSVPEPPREAPPVEIGHDDLDLNPTPEADPDEQDELILEPAVDHLGRPLDPAAEGIGEPDPLILAKSPATLMSTTHRLIPGPTDRAEAQDQDAVLAVVKDWVRQRVMPERLELDFGESQLKAYVKVIPALRLCQLPAPDNLDILVKTDIQGKEKSERYCMPEKLIDPFIRELHLRLTHYGVETMVLTMKHLVWFPHMWTRVRQVLQVCPGCVQKHNKQLDKRIAGCYYPREKGNVASYVHLDLAGPLPRTPDGFKYILGIQCNFSGYCVAVPIKNKEHETVVKGFLDNWLFRFGPPVALISDNEWSSQAFTALCRSFQVEQRRTPFYNPRSNAQIERTFGTLKRLLRAVTRGLNQGAWGDWLPPTVFSLNITVSRTTGISPYQLVHGTDPPLPLATVVGVPERTPLDPAEYMLTLSTNMGRLLITAREKYQIYIRRTADTYITPSPLGSQEPLGMRVWCWSPYRKRGTSGALAAKWSGPWRIVQFKPPALTLLQSEWLHLKGKPEVQREAVIDKIRPYLETGEIQEDLEDDEIAMMDGDEESTDPYVEATDILERIHLITCRTQRKKRKTKKSDLIKDEGEGDWGTGETETEDHPIQEGDLQLLPTDWPREFHPLEPRIRPAETSQDTVPQHQAERADEGTSPELQKKDADKKVGNEALAEEGADRPDQLITNEANRQGSPTCGRSHKTGGEKQKESVAQQKSEGQHSQNNQPIGPKSMGDRASRSRGRSYQPLQRLQDKQKKGLHLRSREQGPEEDEPPAKTLRPFRLTRPRETEAEEDKPPSKVRKSVQWMKSLLGSRHGAEKQGKEGKEQEEGGEEGRSTPARKEEEESETKTEPGPSPHPGQESQPEHSSSPPMEEA